VSFRTPVSGQALSGQLSKAAGNCEALASDAGGVERVEFFLDEQPLNTERSAPYSCVVDTRAYPDGAHTLTARAYDAAGNTSSASVDVTFANAAPKPAPWPKPAPRPRPAPKPTHPRPSKPRVRSRRLVFLNIAPAASRFRPVRRGARLKLVGQIATSHAGRPHRVLIQVFTRGRWRTVAVTGSARRGSFKVRWRVASRRGARALRIRAVVPGVGSSTVRRLLLRR
jgi:Big-like domain-containing protein